MQNILNGEDYFRKKKEFTLYLLSVLIFMIHISSIAQYTPSGSMISVLNEKVAFFLKESFHRFAIPMFFIVSGVAFFKGYTEKQYPAKLKATVFSMVIPYLLWNVIWVLFELICSHPYISQFFIARVPFELTPENVLLGVFFNQYNGSFWFIFDLIVFAAAAPLLYQVIRNKYVGIVTILVLIVASRFGIHLPSAVFYSINSIIYYLIGGLIGIHMFHLVARKSGKAVRIVSIVGFVLYVILKNLFFAEPYQEKAVVDVIVFCLCSFFVWNILDMFMDKFQLKKRHSRALAVLTMHINVSAVIAKLIYLCLPKTEWLAIPNFVATFVLSLAFINLFCWFLERFLPTVSGLLQGRRDT